MAILLALAWSAAPLRFGGAESPVPQAEVYGSALLLDHTPLVTTIAPATAFVLAMDEYGQVLQGSGVVVRADGWIATSYDLVAWTDVFEVQIAQADLPTLYEARLARVYPELGLALLHITADDLATLAAAAPEDLVPGARVVSLGYPSYNQLERGLRLSRGSLASPVVSQEPAGPTLRAQILYLGGLAGSAVCTTEGALIGMLTGPEPGTTTVRILPASELLARADAAAAANVPVPD